MSKSLREVLTDILEGEAILQSRGQLELLRRIASFDELEKLAPIEKEFLDAERRQRGSAVVQPPTKADAQRVIEHPGGATVEELQSILCRAIELRLSSGQVECIRSTLSTLAAERFRGESKSELQRLGFLETPRGPIDPHTARAFERLRVAGLARIEACQDHARRGCGCFRDIRERLWQLGNTFSDAMPEGWLARQILYELDSHELLKAANPRLAQ